MGVGSFLSKYIEKNIALTFVQVELLIGLIGGASATLLFLMFNHIDNFRILLYSLVAIIGILVGLEIPLLMRILQQRAGLQRPGIADIYLWLCRRLVSLTTLSSLARALPWLDAHIFSLRPFQSRRSIVDDSACLRRAPLAQFIEYLHLFWLWCLFQALPFSDRLMGIAESATYQDPVICLTTTPYQRIVLTGNSKDLRLFLNGNLQFSSRDEYRYHEALIHPAMASLNKPQDILVLGGGDGLAVRKFSNTLQCALSPWST